MFATCTSTNCFIGNNWWKKIHAENNKRMNGMIVASFIVTCVRSISECIFQTEYVSLCRIICEIQSAVAKRKIERFHYGVSKYL